MHTPSPHDILRNIEPDFIVEYCKFGGVVRQYVTTRLQEGFGENYHPVVRRFHALNLVAQQYGAYEDAAAVLKAVCEFRTGSSPFPLAALMDYRPGEAVISAVLEAHGINSEEMFRDVIRADEWVPPEWQSWFPAYDINKGLGQIARFFVTDCKANHKLPAIAAFNKVKHGLLVVESARAFVPTMPDVPGCLINTPKAIEGREANPFAVYAFPIDTAGLKDRASAVYFVQTNLRILLALYVCSMYPSHRAVRRSGGLRGLIESDEFHDVRHFLGEVTEKR